MNRGFIFYFSKGWEKAWSSLVKKKNLFNYYFLLFAYVLSYLCIFTIPFGKMIKVRLARLSITNSNIRIDKSIMSFDQNKIYSKVLMSIAFKTLIFLGIIVACAFVSGGLYHLGRAIQFVITTYADASVSSSVVVQQLPWIFMIPAGIVLVVLMLLYTLLFSPIDFIIDASEDIKMSSIFLRSIETMKRKGIWTLILLFIVFIIENAVIGGLMFVTQWQLIGNKEVLLKLLGYFVLFTLILLYIILFPVITLSFLNAEYMLFDDIILDKVNSNKLVRGVYIKHQSSNRRRNKNAKMDLVDLFDEEEEVSINVNVTNKEETTKLKVDEKIEEIKEEEIEVQDDEIIEEVIQEEPIKEVEPIIEEKHVEPKVEVKEEPKVEEKHVELVEEKQVEPIVEKKVETKLIEKEVVKKEPTKKVEEDKEEAMRKKLEKIRSIKVDSSKKEPTKKVEVKEPVKKVEPKKAETKTVVKPTTTKSSADEEMEKKLAKIRAIKVDSSKKEPAKKVEPKSTTKKEEVKKTSVSKTKK